MATAKFYDDKIAAILEKQKVQYAHAIGQFGVNQARAINPVKTGASKSAKAYRVLKDKVQIYAPLDYDIWLERRYGILKIALEEVSRVAEPLAKRVFRI